MGCSAAKNLTVEPMDGNKVAQISNGTHNGQIPATFKIDKVSSLAKTKTEFSETDNVNNVHHTTNGLSFDIPFEKNERESIIRKHPPRRFQKLEDQQTSPTMSLVRLQEKLDEAEIRRHQILQNRVQSARKVLKKQSTVYSINEEDTNHLKVPQDKPDTPFITSSNRIANHNEVY